MGDRRQSLLLAVKETQWSCISKYSVIVSAFTDVYKDPVFLCNIKPHQTDHCCRITTANPNSIIGFISASTRNSFLLTNQAEDLILNTTVSSETPGTVVYDVNYALEQSRKLSSLISLDFDLDLGGYNICWDRDLWISQGSLYYLQHRIFESNFESALLRISLLPHFIEYCWILF